MEIEFNVTFHKQYLKSNVRIRHKANECLRIFRKNPQDSSLNNHELKREWEGYRSIDITADFRAIYIEKKIGEKISAYFVRFGTHEDLYS